MHNILVYAGKQTPLLPLPTHSHTTKVVLTLVDYMRDKGHDLYTDRFYTSVELADELTKMGFSITGTIQKNRKFLPTKIKKLSTMSKGSVITFRKKEKMLLAWMDKRIVFMLSTKYSNNMVDIQTRLVVLLMFVYVVITFYSRDKSRVVKKPEVVAEYNQFMLGVDKIDQMMSYYSFVRKSIKWWRKVYNLGLEAFLHAMETLNWTVRVSVLVEEQGQPSFLIKNAPQTTWGCRCSARSGCSKFLGNSSMGPNEVTCCGHFVTK